MSSFMRYRLNNKLISLIKHNCRLLIEIYMIRLVMMRKINELLHIYISLLFIDN